MRWKYICNEGGSIFGAYWLKRGLYSPNELAGLMGNDYLKEYAKTLKPASFIEDIVKTLSDDPAINVGQIESQIYLRNQLLRDGDWASMAHSVELRTPLVDIELLQSLSPLFSSFKDFKGKNILAHTPDSGLGKKILERKKTGFGVPADWLRSLCEQNKGNSKNINQLGVDSKRWAKVVAESCYD